MIWLVVFGVMLLVVAGMAIGVMAGRRPLMGSCGGIALIGVEKECAFCGGKPENCKRRKNGEPHEHHHH